MQRDYTNPSEKQTEASVLTNSSNKQSTLKAGVVFNLLSFAILAVCGLLLNILIARLYEAETLGIFNLSFAVYIVFSQLSTFGIQLSLLRFVPIAKNSSEEGVITTSALLAVTITGIVLSALMLALLPYASIVFSSDKMKESLLLIIPGVFFFGLNKCLLNILNAKLFMKAFSIFQASRYILILLFFFVFVHLGYEGKYISLILTCAELILFLSLIVYAIRNLKLTKPNRFWIKKHFHFGSRSILGGAMIELNSKIDILMLGFFLSESKVGLYSMAALIVEGISQFPVVVRNNVNPRVAKYIENKDYQSLYLLISKVKKLVYAVMVIVFAGGWFLYQPVVEFLTGTSVYNETFIVFIVLLSGIAIRSGYIPFNMLLGQGGYPMMQSRLLALFFMTNVVLNFILIPLYGGLGAAVATAGAFVMSAIYLKVLVKKCLNIKL